MEIRVLFCLRRTLVRFVCRYNDATNRDGESSPCRHPGLICAFPPPIGACCGRCSIAMRPRRPTRCSRVSPTAREWTYRQTQAIARRTAIGLARTGRDARRPGAVVAAQRADAIRVWFGLNYLGAVYVPINLAYRGGAAGACRRQLRCAADRGPRRSRRPARRHRSRGADDGRRAERRGARDARASRCTRATRSSRPMASCRRSRARSRRGTCRRIIYTSGTTGPSKGVMSSYLQLYTMGTRVLPVARRRTTASWSTCRCSMSAARRRSTRCWRSAARSRSSRRSTPPRSGGSSRETGTTACVLLGVMATFLVKQPPGPQDREPHADAPPSWCRCARTPPRSRSASAATSTPSST